MTQPVGIQKTWFDLVNRLGELEARRELARQLRRAADMVEDADGYPDVFGCEVWEGADPCNKEIMDTVSVTLSMPWPG